MKVWRVTLAFEPIATLDVIGNDVMEITNNIMEYLRKLGNKVDETIITKIELFSIIEDLELEPEKPDIIDLINNEKGELL
jgi:ABC-type phosphate/phosphonate transport system ATPase subunit